MPTLESEILLIEAISQSQVIAIALSHENLTEQETQKIIKGYENRLRLPTTDVLTDGCQKIIRALSNRFPTLYQPTNARILR